MKRMLAFVKGVKIIGNHIYGNGLAGYPLIGGDIIIGGISGAQFGNDATRFNTNASNASKFRRIGARRRDGCVSYAR